ncbi:hypothetical protein CPB83DRAFT_895978 [Crepidotus variabilis]|uniref:SAP domain-containing protein n=1 Tax=Crepidotus variabilis TaxID=179855 RepID=A0A9P6ECL4_9AGAR|nr:hypothetical protein CPB83DRAFT_895978 [Crepidotus variabilis]
MTTPSPADQVRRAYQRLTHEELLLFLKVRNLPTAGTDADLASRLSNHDIHTYHFSINPRLDQPSPSSSSGSSYTSLTSFAKRRVDLPVEIIADILDHLGDWELSKAVGVPTSLTQPSDWKRATRTDQAVLTGNVALIIKAQPSARDNPLTKIGALLAVRFGYVQVLDYFLRNHYRMFLESFDDDLVPIKASRHGRIDVLNWWKLAVEQHPEPVPYPKRYSVAEAVDRASRNGYVDSLDWWLNWGHSFDYTEAALEYASAKNQIAVLNWWKKQNKRIGLPLKIGRSMDMASTAGHVDVLEWWAMSQLEPKYDKHALQHASCHGKVEVLQWWLGSGMPLIFDQEALTSATRHNRPEVLEWWAQSGLPIQYRMCDIEEALEESIIPGDDARHWWRKRGVDFTANDKEWMKLQSLN